MADCFIKIDQVKGEAQDQDLKDYIQVDSWQWGVAWTGAIAGANVRKSGVGTMNSLSFVHQLDSASPGLITRCMSRAVLPNANLIMRRAGGKAQTYVSIKLEKVRVLSVDLVHNEQHVIPAEKVVLNFDRIEYEYTPQSERGADKSGRSTFAWTRGEES